MKKRVNARSKIKEKNARVCRVTVRASTAVIYGRENARSPPQSWNTPNSGEFSDSVVFTTLKTPIHTEKVLFWACRTSRDKLAARAAVTSHENETASCRFALARTAPGRSLRARLCCPRDRID